MAQILVEEDWGKEADENPFPSGMMVQIDGENVYIFVGHPPQPPPPQPTVGEQKKPLYI